MYIYQNTKTRAQKELRVAILLHLIAPLSPFSPARPSHLLPISRCLPCLCRHAGCGQPWGSCAPATPARSGDEGLVSALPSASVTHNFLFCRKANACRAAVLTLPLSLPVHLSCSRQTSQGCSGKRGVMLALHQHHLRCHEAACVSKAAVRDAASPCSTRAPGQLSEAHDMYQFIAGSPAHLCN